MADTKAIALNIIAASDDLRTQCAALTFEKLPQDLMQIVPIVMQGAAKVEEYASQAGGLTGPEKKEVLVKALDELIKLPAYLEPLDGPAIGWMIDYIVLGLNKLFGKDWHPFEREVAVKVSTTPAPKPIDTVVAPEAPRNDD